MYVGILLLSYLYYTDINRQKKKKIIRKSFFFLLMSKCLWIIIFFDSFFDYDILNFFVHLRFFTHTHFCSHWDCILRLKCTSLFKKISYASKYLTNISLSKNHHLEKYIFTKIIAKKLAKKMLFHRERETNKKRIPHS